MKKIIKKIEKDGIFNQSSFKNYDIAALLDSRDDEVFDGEWMRVFNTIKKAEIDDLEQRDIDNIREKAFKIAYESSLSSDIAACVSDDFEMICKAYIIGLNDKWLNALILSYANQEFPCGALTLKDYSRKEVYESLVK